MWQLLNQIKVTGYEQANILSSIEILSNSEEFDILIIITSEIKNYIKDLQCRRPGKLISIIFSQDILKFTRLPGGQSHIGWCYSGLKI